MKDMQFAIDIIWLDDDRVVGFEKNVQPENPATTFYRPQTSINRVLEVPSGTVDEFELVVENQLDIKFRAK
jgi:uncharacterized membrane protein (UPF0127 family)